MGNTISLVIAVLLFLAGAGLTIFAAERLLEGLVSHAFPFRLSAFAIGAVLSGLEAKNIAVGLVAGGQGAAEVSLGTVFEGAIFLICVALDLATPLFPLEALLLRSVLAFFAASPLLAGLTFWDRSHT